MGLGGRRLTLAQRSWPEVEARVKESRKRRRRKREERRGGDMVRRGEIEST